MKKFWSIWMIITMMVFTSCSDDSPIVEPEVQGTEISEFYFSQSNNTNLNWDQFATIENEIISGRLPLGVDMQSMVANFEHNG